MPPPPISGFTFAVCHTFQHDLFNFARYSLQLICIWEEVENEAADALQNKRDAAISYQN